jgi:hypothetical protein
MVAGDPFSGWPYLLIDAPWPAVNLAYWGKNIQIYRFFIVGWVVFTHIGALIWDGCERQADYYSANGGLRPGVPILADFVQFNRR